MSVVVILRGTGVGGGGKCLVASNGRADVCCVPRCLFNGIGDDDERQSAATRDHQRRRNTHNELRPGQLLSPYFLASPAATQVSNGRNGFEVYK